jgi:hypothetical protein
MPNNPKETAEFIRTLTSELATLARDAKLDSLSYILDVARHEASQAELTAAAPSQRNGTLVGRSRERKPKRARKRAA